MTRRRHLALVAPAPAVPEPRPLISTQARRTEAEGKPFYPRTRLAPEQLPETYRTLTSYARRVERKGWRVPVAVVVGTLVGLAALGLSDRPFLACALGAVAGLAMWASDGWLKP